MFDKFKGILRRKNDDEYNDNGGITGFIPAFEDIEHFKKENKINCSAKIVKGLIQCLEKAPDQKWYVFKSVRKKGTPLNVGMFDDFPTLDQALDWLETYGGDGMVTGSSAPPGGLSESSTSASCCSDFFASVPAASCSLLAALSSIGCSVVFSRIFSPRLPSSNSKISAAVHPSGSCSSSTSSLTDEPKGENERDNGDVEPDTAGKADEADATEIAVFEPDPRTKRKYFSVAPEIVEAWEGSPALEELIRDMEYIDAWLDDDMPDRTEEPAEKTETAGMGPNEPRAEASPSEAKIAEPIEPSDADILRAEHLKKLGHRHCVPVDDAEGEYRYG